MMDFHTSYLYAINNLDEETLQGIFQKLREETRDLPLEALDDALDPDLAHVLSQHGCTIVNHTDFRRVIFPKGTTCKLLFVVRSSHYLLTLPSGLKVIQIEKAKRIYSLLCLAKGQSDGE